MCISPPATSNKKPIIHANSRIPIIVQIMKFTPSLLVLRIKYPLTTIINFFRKNIAIIAVACYNNQRGFVKRLLIVFNKLLINSSFNIYPCGCSLVVKPQPSKLMSRVRFPSPAPYIGLNVVFRFKMKHYVFLLC